MKIEALTDKMNAEIRGKVPKEDKLRAAISETVQRAGFAELACGEAGDPGHKHAVVLAMACQMLWNALEDAKAEIEDLKRTLAGFRCGIDEAKSRGSRL